MLGGGVDATTLVAALGAGPQSLPGREYLRWALTPCGISKFYLRVRPLKVLCVPE